MDILIWHWAAALFKIVMLLSVLSVLTFHKYKKQNEKNTQMW
jgi:uncharacterized membrane protein